MSHRTTFTDPAAVDAWDAWFRWRDGRLLHDRTIEATWARLVEAVAGVEDPHAGRWSQRWLDGLSQWQWLPDELLLRLAGTGVAPQASAPLTATVNLQALVIAGSPYRPSAVLDTEAIEDAATAAVRFLDDARLAFPGIGAAGVRIGLMGMGDALAALGIDYDSPAALEVAAAAGAALATGTLRGAIALARERGGVAPVRERLDALVQCGLPPPLREAALRWGVREAIRTAIAPAPRLALLANNVSDALDPRPPARVGGDRGFVGPMLPSADAQRRLRAAIQPWIDMTIDYPFVIGGEAQAMRPGDAHAAGRSGSRPPAAARVALPLASGRDRSSGKS